MGKETRFHYILLFFLFLFILACKASRNVEIKKGYRYFRPPGVTEIAKNLYLDKTEITNMNYREFAYWMGAVYGRHSVEYKQILPDTNVWSRFHENYKLYDSIYYRHPLFDDHPCVGVTYEQAKAFAEWRTNRVFQMILVERGLMPLRESKRDSFFTVQRYFEGKYYGMVADTNLIVPVYFLPDPTIYKLATKVSDSIFLKKKWKRPKNCSRAKEGLENYCFEKIFDRTDTFPFGTIPTVPVVFHNCLINGVVTQLNGNVSELLNDKNFSFGNSFADSCSTIQNIYSLDPNEVNCYTGFRNACTFKKWRQLSN
jgi:hypothetical protein